MKTPLARLPWKRIPPDPTVAKGEQLIEYFSTHWIKYVAPTLIVIGISGGAGLLLWLAESASRASPAIAFTAFLISLCIGSIALHWYFHRLLSEAMIDVIITSKRLLFLQSNLWLNDDMHEVALERIRAVEAHKHGIVQNLLRYGELWFDTGGSDIESGRLIQLVPHPHTKAKRIMQLLNMR